jgi:5-methylcytosine-specific restriction endonuclease McrA
VPNCPRAVYGRGRCVEHKRQAWREYEERRPDRKETLAFYHSAAWQKARKEALERTGGCCVECSAPTPAAHVDHVRPVKDGGDPLDQSNLSPLCLFHHSRKTMRENWDAGKLGRKCF